MLTSWSEVTEHNRGREGGCTHLFALGELRVDELAVENARSFRVGRHEPDDETDFDFIVERKPAIHEHRS